MTWYEEAEPSQVRAIAVLPAISAVPANSAAPADTPDETDSSAADPDGDVVDPMMLRDAQHLLSRHAEPDPDGKCGWCGWRWPCPPRRLAERAEVVARRPRRPVPVPDGYAGGFRHGIPDQIRHDVPAWRSELDLRADQADPNDPDAPVSPAASIQSPIRGVVRLPRQQRNDPPAPA